MKTKKIKLLLKLCFNRWLSAASEEKILQSHKSMTVRSTVLGYGGINISFYRNSAIASKKYAETHSFFNQLIFNVLDELLPGKLDDYELFRGNINFHADSEGHTQS